MGLCRFLVELAKGWKCLDSRAERGWGNSIFFGVLGKPLLYQDELNSQSDIFPLPFASWEWYICMYLPTCVYRYQPFIGKYAILMDSYKVGPL